MLDKKIQNRILQIKNLKMIQLYQLFGEGHSIGGVCALYDDEVINLCEADPGFELLLDHLAKVYFSESVFRKIVTDGATKDFLEKCRAIRTNGYDAVLEGFEEEKVPMCVQKAYAWQFVLPVVQYVVQKLYEFKNASLEFDVNESHWFTQGVLLANSDAGPKRFPYYFDETAEEAYAITVSNVLKAGNQLKMKLSYGRKGVTATFEEQAYFLSGALNVSFGAKEPRTMLRICEHGKEAEVSSTDCEVIEGDVPSPSAQSFLAKDGADWKAYRLPWGLKFYFASSNGEEAVAYVAEGIGATVSIGTRSKRLSENPQNEASLGIIAFHLYEREVNEEVHLLHIGVPGVGAGVYENRYAGRYFIRTKTIGQRVSEDGSEHSRD